MIFSQIPPVVHLLIVAFSLTFGLYLIKIAFDKNKQLMLIGIYAARNKGKKAKAIDTQKVAKLIRFYCVVMLFGILLLANCVFFIKLLLYAN